MTMPSEVAKNVRTCKIKWRSLSLSLFVQLCTSFERSISSAVQKHALAFLYRKVSIVAAAYKFG